MRKGLWFLGFILGCLLLSETGSAGTMPRPNILFIFTDDQSHRSVGCYPEAHPWVKTPNIDRLAAEGVRFANAYSGTWCLPSRAMVLTGLLPHAIRGLKVQRNPISRYDPDVCRFWPAALRQGGYETAFIGKWHLSPDTGHGRDWDHSTVWNHTVPEAGGYYRNQRLSFDGRPCQSIGGYSTDNYTDYAIEFICRAHDRPWFLWLCYDAPHTPYMSAERHRGLYRNNEPVPIPVDIYPPRPDKPRYMLNYGVWTKGLEGLPIHGNRTLPEAVRQYNRTVAALDEGVGRILAALDVAGQLNNTLIVYTSDQGFAWGQHGFEWKVAPYDANLRAPLLVRLPGKVAQGKVCQHPVCALDLIPTFFTLANTPLPWKMHGHDLSPLLTNPQANWPYPVLLEHFRWSFGSETDGARTGNAAFSGVPWWLSLRQGKYKYIRTLVEDEVEELYDLQSDPEELHNLALEEKYKDMLADWRQRLEAELRRTNAALADRLPHPQVKANRPLVPSR